MVHLPEQEAAGLGCSSVSHHIRQPQCLCCSWDGGKVLGTAGLLAYFVRVCADRSHRSGVGICQRRVCLIAAHLPGRLHKLRSLPLLAWSNPGHQHHCQPAVTWCLQSHVCTLVCFSNRLTYYIYTIVNALCSDETLPMAFPWPRASDTICCDMGRYGGVCAEYTGAVWCQMVQELHTWYTKQYTVLAHCHSLTS